jgi:phenylpyruvate tautomerase PptA (4-oxalocrotonate tautomerase family)
MASVSSASMTMAGTSEPAAFLDVRSIGGLSQGVNREISKRVAALLGERLKIPANRIYIGFTSVEGVNWGYNGSTFG